MKSALPVLIFTSDNPDFPRQILATRISVEGINIQTEIRLALKSQITLEIATSLGKLTLQAIVVKQNPDGYACQFVDMDSRTAQKLSQWLYPPFEP